MSGIPWCMSVLSAGRAAGQTCLVLYANQESLLCVWVGYSSVRIVHGESQVLLYSLSSIDKYAHKGPGDWSVFMGTSTQQTSSMVGGHLNASH